MEILDDLIPKTFVENIEQTLMSPNFPWYLNLHTVNKKKDPPSSYFEDNNCLDSNQFTHIFYTTADGIFSQSYHIVTPFITLLEQYTKKDYFNKLLRIKANLITKDKEYPENFYNIPHVDCCENSVESLLYYVNDSEGDTFIFNEKKDTEFKKLSLNKRIKPKKGRCVYFDSDYFHSSSPPRNTDLRIVINFVFRKHK